MSAEIYLNNAGTSYPKPKSVVQAIGETLVAPPETYPQIYQQALKIVEQALGVPAGRTLLTSSCTQALDVALSELSWASGDVVLTSQLEHNAVVRPVENLVRNKGAVHKRVPYRPGQPLDLEFIEKVLKQGKTRLLMLSTASNVTGEVLPLMQAVELAHRYGALVFADAAQTFGVMDESPAALGVDLIAFAGHKGPLGTQGIGGLWVKPGVTFSQRISDGAPVTCEVGKAKPGRGDCTYEPMPGYCDVGGVNMPALAGMAAGLRAFGEERKTQMLRARQLAAELARGAREMRGVRVFGHHAGVQTAIVSLQHEALPLNTAEAYFSSHNIRVRAGSHCAPDAMAAIQAPAGTIRISFGPHNNSADLARVLSALAGAKAI